MLILLQMFMFFYFINTNIQVKYSINCLFLLSFLGIMLIFDDDNLIGTRQFISCPSL